MFKVTKEQKEKLLKAASLAKGPGGCSYSNYKQEPICVIAQLAVMEGVDPKVFAEWDSFGSFNNVKENGLPENDKLNAYEMKLLLHVQDFWDTMLPKYTLEEARSYLIEMINNLPVVD